MEMVLTGRIRIRSGDFPEDEIMEVFKEGFRKSNSFLSMIRRIAGKEPSEFSPKESLAQNLLYVALSEDYQDIRVEAIASKIEEDHDLTYHESLQEPPEISIEDGELIISSESNAQPWILGMAAAAIMRAYNIDGIATGGISARLNEDGPARNCPHFGMNVAASKYGHKIISCFDLDKQTVKDLEDGAHSFIVTTKDIGESIATQHEAPIIVRIQGVYDDEAHLIHDWVLENMGKSLGFARSGQVLQDQLPEKYKDMDLQSIASKMDLKDFKQQIERLKLHPLSSEALESLKNVFFVNDWHYTV